MQSSNQLRTWVVNLVIKRAILVFLLIVAARYAINVLHDSSYVSYMNRVVETINNSPDPPSDGKYGFQLFLVFVLYERPILDDKPKHKKLTCSGRLPSSITAS